MGLIVLFLCYIFTSALIHLFVFVVSVPLFFYILCADIYCIYIYIYVAYDISTLKSDLMFFASYVLHLAGRFSLAHLQDDFRTQEVPGHHR